MMHKRIFVSKIIKIYWNIHHTLVQIMKDEWDMKVGQMLTYVNISFHPQKRRPYKKLASITFSTLLRPLVRSNCEK